LILTRNKLGDEFAIKLQKTICGDNYLAMIDLSGN